MIGMIVATDKNLVIGANNKMCWSYPEDFKRFKAITMGATLIMGSKTWQSIPGTLPGRNIIVISSQKEKELTENRKNLADLMTRFEVVKSVDKAFERAEKRNVDVWIAGGASIYSQTMNMVDIIDYTLVPEVVFEPITEPVDIKYFPIITNNFILENSVVNENDSRLLHQRYKKVS